MRRIPAASLSGATVGDCIQAECQRDYLIFKVETSSIFSDSPFEKGQNLFNGHTVQDMLRLTPAAAGDTDTEAH